MERGEKGVTGKRREISARPPGILKQKLVVRGALYPPGMGLPDDPAGSVRQGTADDKARLGASNGRRGF